jgi:hypothetical protein
LYFRGVEGISRTMRSTLVVKTGSGRIEGRQANSTLGNMNLLSGEHLMSHTVFPKQFNTV